MRSYALFVVGLILLLSACSGGEESLPTLIPTGTLPAGGETSLPATAESAATVVLAETATATRAAGRPTLPPTFTPTTAPTEEPTATEFFPTSTLFIPAATADPGCNNFGSNFGESNTIFNLGETPRATWAAIPGAELYRLIVRSSVGEIVYDQLLTETTATFPANLFANGLTYGWVVYPINGRGDQMCSAIGLELIPVTPFGAPGS